MSTELIRKVMIKPDGIYLYSKSNNDDRPFHNWKCDSLTDVYRQEGRPGLDREMVRMFCEYAEIQGRHPSVDRYRPCLREGAALRETLTQSLNAEYAKLTPEDISAIWRPYEETTDGARAYRAFERGAHTNFYAQLAALADKLPDKEPRQSDLSR